MIANRLARAVSASVLLLAASFAGAATTQFRVFFDTDRNPVTGCTIGGMNGVEQVLVTQVTDSGNAARVTRTFRQLCTAGSLGVLIDDDISGWDAALQSSSRELTFETRMRLSAFGPGGITRDMRLGFEATRTPAIHTALVNDDGSHVVLPESADRRRAVRSPGGDRRIVLDGNLADWTGLGSAIYGMASGGTLDLRLLRVFDFEDLSGPPSEKFLYFAVVARLGSDAPFADDDVYNRQEGQSLSVPGPGVLANDGDPLGQDMDAEIVSEPKRGSVALNEEEGGFTYSPDNPQSKASDSFEYKVRAGTRESNVARVKIKVRDGEGNEPPSFTAGGNVTIAETSGLYSEPWATNISPGAGETQTVSFTVTNDNNGLFTTQPAIAPDGTLRFVPVANQSGIAIVTVILTDSEGASTMPVTFIITVTRVNNAPTFNIGENQLVAEDSGPQTVSPWATSISPGPADESGQSVSFTVTGNTNPSLFSSGPSVSPTGVLTYTPAPNANGTATITLRLTDNGNPSASSSLKTFMITVTPVNDNPSFTAGADPVNVNEDSGAFSASWATAISAGPLEPSQTVSFTVTNNNNALFSAQPAIDSSGTLTFTPAANANGSALVSVTLFDNLGGSSAPAVTFTINVAAVNDLPSFVKGADVVVLDTSGAQTVAGWATALSAGPANESGQALDFIVSNNNPTLFSVAPAIAPNGTLTYTPAAGQDGVATVTVQIHDNGGTANGGVDTSASQTFTITVERVPAITSGNTTTFLVGQPGTFSVTTTGRPRPDIAQTGTLPTGVTFVDGTGVNKGTGVLSGTTAAGTGGSYPITFQATNVRGSSPVQNFTLIVNQPAAITSANTATFNQGAAGSFTVTTTGFPLPGLTLTGAAVPAGLTFTDNGNGTATLTGTPTAAGGSYRGFTLTASNGIGANATQSFTIIINQAPVITSANSTGFNATVAGSFTVTTTGFPAPALSQTGALPTGITFTDNGNGTATLGGTALQGQGGVYTITITATNAAGSVPQTFTITVCNVIAVTIPATTSGVAGSPFSQTFTQTGAVGSATFTLASGTLPTGLNLATSGVLSGTPTQGGTFPITVLVTDANGCTGVGGTYNLVITCPTITVNNPANANGTANSAFSETFTQTGGVGTATFSLASGTLPAGLTLAANGVLSGSPTQAGSFPITVTATDANGCSGTGATYTIVIGCQTITVTNPGTANGTANSAFSQTFTQSGAIGTATFTLASGTLPAGLTLAANGVLSGTPTQTGSFPITVTATDANGCTGTSATYTIDIACQTITVTNPATTTGTVSAAFSQTFTQSGAIGTATFTTASTLPSGLSLSTAGVLSGTPTQSGSFPIVVTVTDSNGCTGTSATYTLVIGCQTITVTNPANASGTVSTGFSETFTQSAAVGGATFTLASGVLPAGITLATNGVLSGTPTQSGSFPITVTVTDGNGCTGTSSTYTLVIGCQTITVTNPSNATGPAGSAFSETFTQSGAIGTATFTTASTLPTGLTLSTAGVLSGTPAQGGTFPITVIVTDSNGCTGTSATYSLIITCPTITVNNPATTTGTVDAAFSQTFTQSGSIGTATFTTSSTLPSGLTLSTAGVLSGTPGQPGTFSITVLVTDSNGCTGTSATYTLVIACQTITVSNPATTTGTVDTAFSQTFTQVGVGTHTPIVWSETGALPSGLTLNSVTGVLSGTPGQPGSSPITVTATDANGCAGTGATYTLVIACQTITVTNPGVTTATFNAAFTRNFTQVGVGTHTPATFTTSSTLPTGVTLSSAGVLAGTPTQTGTFPIIVTVTDANGCTGTGATYTLAVAPVANNDTINGGVGNTQLTLTGGLTGITGTPTVQVAGTIEVNDLPSAATVTVVAGVFGTTAGGSVTVAADGTFRYTPPVNPAAAAITSDTFNYTATSNTGGTGPVTSAPGTVTINLVGRVWYVENDAGGGGNGGSQFPFNILASAQTASTANDYVYVYVGDGTTLNQNAGFVLKAGQRLIGMGVALVVNGSTLIPPGPHPRIGHPAGDAVTIGNAINTTIRGLSISGSSNAIDMTTSAGAAGTTTISNNIIFEAFTEGIEIALNAGTSGNLVLAITNNTWNLGGIHFGTAVHIDVNAGALRLNLSDNTNIVSSGLAAVQIDGTGGGTTTITGFANNTVSGNSAQNGVLINTVKFDADPATTAYEQVGGGITLIGALGNGVNGWGLDLFATSGDLAFTDLDIFADAGVGLRVGGTGAVNTGAGTGTRVTVTANAARIEATGNAAVILDNLTTDLQLSSLRSTASLGAGVSLTTVAGTFSAGSGSTITDATGTDFNINAGSANVTYAGTITDDVGKLVNITGQTGTSLKAFTGAITDGDDGDGSGISLTGNSATTTMRFSGGVVLSTQPTMFDDASFTATGGGIVEVCDENPCNAGATGLLINRITTNFATALNVVNTTIGANNLEFRSISAIGGSNNGIILSVTGASGGLKVKGTGTAGSGGTIANKTGADGSTTQGSGIYLNSTSGVSLERMQLNDFDNFAIRGTSVTGFSLLNSVISGANGNNADVGFDESSIRFDGLFTSAAFPAASITGCDITGGMSDNIAVVNNSGTLNRLTISSTIVRFHDSATGKDAIHFEGFNAGTNMNLTISSCTFKGARGDMIDANARIGVTMDVVIRGNSFTNEQASVVSGNTPIIVQGAGTMTYEISCNKIKQLNAAGTVGTGQGHGINVAKSTTGGSFSGTVFNNAIGMLGVQSSGAGLSGSGINFISSGTGTHTALIKNNVINNYGESGIRVVGHNGNSTANVTIIGNTTTQPHPTSGLAGLYVDAGAFATDSNIVNVKVGGSGAEQNDFTAGIPLDPGDIRVNRTLAAGNTVQLNLTRPPSVSGVVSVVLQDNNTGTPTTNNSGTIALVDTSPATPAAIDESCSPPL